jgi:hypothetical protein
VLSGVDDPPRLLLPGAAPQRPTARAQPLVTELGPAGLPEPPLALEVAALPVSEPLALTALSRDTLPALVRVAAASGGAATVLSSAASQCALRGAVALAALAARAKKSAAIAAAQPATQPATASLLSGPVDDARAAAATAADTAADTAATAAAATAVAALALEALWLALPALGRLLAVLRGWVGHPAQASKRPWAAALDDLAEVTQSS